MKIAVLFKSNGRDYRYVLGSRGLEVGHTDHMGKQSWTQSARCTNIAAPVERALVLVLAGIPSVNTEHNPSSYPRCAQLTSDGLFVDIGELSEPEPTDEDAPTPKITYREG